MISPTNADLDPQNGVPESSNIHHGSQALMVRPAETGTLTPYMPGGIGTPHFDGTPQGVSISQLMHALRRRWLLAVLTGLFVGLPLAAMVWLIIPDNSDVQAMLHVGDPQQFMGGNGSRDPGAYEQYRKSQALLIKSHAVLVGALHEEGILDLPIVHAEKGRPEQFLDDEVQVVAPYGSEFLFIKMRGRYPSQMVKVVNAVKDSYMKNIVNVERRETLVERDLLESRLREQQSDLDKKRQESIRLENLYGSESPAKEAERLMLDQQLTSKNQEIMTKNSEIGSIEGQLLMRKIRDEQGYQVPQWLVEKLMEQDPQIQDFEKSLQQYKTALGQVQGAVKNPAHDPTVKTYKAQVASLENQLQTRKEELQPKVIEQLKMAGDGKEGTNGTSSLEELKGRKAAAVDAVAKLQEQYDQLAQQRVNLFKNSAELRRLNAEIQETQSFVTQLKARKDQLDINLQLPPRVTLTEAASQPEGTSAFFRIMLAAFAGIVGLVVGAGAVVGMEYQAHRLSTTTDVSTRTGLRVLGTVPNLTALSNAKGLNGSAALAGILAESVDSIRTMLLQQSRKDAPRVVMITSAGEREGKTTVASHLAASLARSGRRTLLVDGDLRSPTAHAMFSAALDPGMSEVLRGEVALEAALQPTQVDGLMLISAGHCDYQAIAALSNTLLSDFFQKAREQFEFVVIDAAPVLAYSDTLLMGGHVDAAVLSSRRDVSQLHKVYEAKERLESVGIRILGAVVNGITETGRRPAYALPAPT